MCERALELQLRLAAEAGATLLTNTPVLSVEPDIDAGGGVTVQTADGRYSAAKAVIAAGPWVNDFTSAADSAALTVTRQVVYWFQVCCALCPRELAGSGSTMACWRQVDDVQQWAELPFLIWAGQDISEYLGAFPIPPASAGGTQALKLMEEQLHAPTTPGSVDRVVSAEEIESFYERKVVPRLAGVGRECVRAEACLYTSTPDEHFLIDTHERSDNVLLLSACSGALAALAPINSPSLTARRTGHGYKHSAALGEACAEWAAEGRSTLSLEPFRRRRSAPEG